MHILWIIPTNGTRSESRCQKRSRELAFTVIELLVVVAIIGILASMLLPALSRAKQKTRVVQCLNNLRQIGTGLTMFEHDNSDTFPPERVSGLGTNGVNGSWLTFDCIGGREARADVSPSQVPPPYLRPLFSYFKPSELFHCPDDHGAGIWVDPAKHIALNPSCWDIAGCSYMYNTPSEGLTPYHKTRLPQEDPVVGMAGKKVGWIPDPSRYILMYEAPARSFMLHPTPNVTMHSFQHWHYSAGDPMAKDITSSAFVYQPRLSGDGRKFVAPILFVDGHAASHDFTSTIRNDPDFVFEATKDWIWYKPSGNQPIPRPGAR